MTRVVKPTGKMADYAATKKGGGILLPQLRKVVLDEFSGPNDHWDEKGMRIIHPSEMAKVDWCPRATYLRIKSGLRPDEGFNFVRENIFDEGNTIHAKWQRRMRKTGKLFGRWSCLRCGEEAIGLEPPIGVFACYPEAGIDHLWEYKEVPLDCEDTHLIAGNADGALLPDNFMVEIKSIGTGTIRIEAPKLSGKYYVETKTGKMLYDLNGLWKDLRRPFSSHVRQGNIYLWLAKQKGLPFDTMVFLYEFKANQQVKEFSVKLSPRIMEPLLDKAETIKYALEHDQDLACEHDGCGECQAMEERVRADKDKPSREDGDATARVSEPGGSPEAGEAENPRRVVGRKAGRGTSPGVTAEHPGPDRPPVDGVVPEVQPVGPVHGAPASGGRGRRTVRRRQGDQAGSSGQG